MHLGLVRGSCESSELGKKDSGQALILICGLRRTGTGMILKIRTQVLSRQASHLNAVHLLAYILSLERTWVERT